MGTKDEEPLWSNSGFRRTGVGLVVQGLEPRGSRRGFTGTRHGLQKYVPAYALPAAAGGEVGRTPHASQ